MSRNDPEWQAIERLLPPNFRELAAEMGVIRAQPSQLEAKITDAAVLLRLLLHHIATGASLKTTTALAAAAQIIDISHVALHKRMITSGPYLAALTSALLRLNAEAAPERWGGYEVILADQTTVLAPGAFASAAGLHYALRLTDLNLLQLYLSPDDSAGETFRHFEPQPEQLWMGDRIYANPPGVAYLADRGAVILVRYNRGALPLFDAPGRPLDVRALVSQCREPGAAREWTVWVHPTGHEPIRGRLCAVKFTPEQAAQSEAWYRRENKGALTEDGLYFTQFLVVFTTAPRQRLGTEAVLALYRLRWQVELRIKRDKSLTALDQLPKYKEETIYTWLVGKILAQHLAQRLATQGVAFSPSGWSEEPWRVTQVIWQALCGAISLLKPLALAAALDTFLEHLSRYNYRKHARAVARERFFSVEAPLVGFG